MPASVPREMEAMIVVVVEEVEDTAAVEAASATNATVLDILPANAGRRRTVATNVTVTTIFYFLLSKIKISIL